MYNHGLGDCFLLTIQGSKPDQKKLMLIDCGILLGSEATSARVRAVAEDIKKTSKELDIVVLTHEHYDHYSGFDLARGEFDDIDMKEVWMGWTEVDDDDLAVRLKDEMRKAGRAVRRAFAQMDALGLHNPYKSLLDFLGEEEPEEVLAAGGSGAKKLSALQYLKQKAIAGNVKYLEPPSSGKSKMPVDIGIEGVRIYVLGPPKDPALLKSLNPDQKAKEGFGDQHLRLFPEDPGFLQALGLDSGTATTALTASEKDYPFSRNYKIPYGEEVRYLVGARLVGEIKKDLYYLVLDLFCERFKELRKIPRGVDILGEKGENVPFPHGVDLENRLKILLKKNWCERSPLEFPSDPQIGSLSDWDLMYRLNEATAGRVTIFDRMRGRWDEPSNQQTPLESAFDRLTDRLQASLHRFLIDHLRKLVKRVHDQDIYDFWEVLKDKLGTDAAKEEWVIIETLALRNKKDGSGGDINEIIMELVTGMVYNDLRKNAGLEDRLADLVNNEKRISVSANDLKGLLRDSLNDLVKYYKVDKERKDYLVLLGFLDEVERDIRKNASGQFSQEESDNLLNYLREGRPAELFAGLSEMDKFIINYERDKWRKIDPEWLRSAEDLAIKLDNYTNNTSLVLAVELVKSGKVLLFPGDAQAGNWRSWKDLKFEWEENGKKLTKTGEQLLKKTVFYKVGHHGSHNATINAGGFEFMKDKELVAMIPVDQITAKRKNGWVMPYGPLLKALHEKTRGKVLIADESHETTLKQYLVTLGIPAEDIPDGTSSQIISKLKKKYPTEIKQVDLTKFKLTKATEMLAIDYKNTGKAGSKPVKVVRPLYFECTVS